MTLDLLKFPIGQFHYNPDCTSIDVENWKKSIAAFPEKIHHLVSTLSSNELNWKYRPEGWTIKQVVHHCADSHMNSLIRFKLALTETNPTIRPYEEHLWAELNDSLTDDLEASIKILEGVHHRWILILNAMNEKDYAKMYFHPSSQRLFSLKEAVGLYAWHGEHHLEHIKQALVYKENF